MSSVVVHYGELALKGRNRPWFINMLVRTIRAALKDLDVGATRKLMGRIEVKLGPKTDWDEVHERLAGLPGIRNFSRATHVAADLDVICAEVVAALAGRTAKSFRVSARRADKRFPVSSMDIERTLGHRIQAVTEWPVNLSQPDLTVHVEVLTSEAFFYFDKHEGAGGLPVGTGGKVVCLLSGGIDSPVAAWRLIRRGCRTDFVHFHSYPILSRTSQDKARTLAALLTRRQLKSRLALVPFGAIQQQVVISVPPPLRVVIYRRLMMRIAEELARRWHAHALVTGDSVGQVASQTIDNLTAVEGVATLPVLRPLIGFDKEEIMDEARRLGSYDTSIVPDEDCCTLFTPRFPATRTSAAAAEAAEANLDVEGLVAKAVAEAVVEDSRFPVLKSAAANRAGDEQ